MNKQMLIFLLFLFSNFVFGQQKEYYPNPKYPELFKTLGVPIMPSDPEWVKEMYQPIPNFWEVNRLYTDYYKKNLFKKNTHTQNYKHFFRIINSNQYYDEKGNVMISNPTTLPKKKENDIQANRSVNAATAWSPLTPFETFDSNGNPKSMHVNVYTLAQSKSNPNVLYCGTETGAVFKTTNKAENWVEVGAQVFDYGASLAIKIDPNNDNVVYVAHDTRLFKSTDGGLTWNIILSSSWQTDVEVHPNNSNIVFASGNFGLKRSTNAGQTWTDILTDSVTDIEFKSNDPNTVFVAKKNNTLKRYEIWKSTDIGLTFSAKTNGWYVPTNGVANHAEGAKIANTLADPNRLYVLLLGNDIDYATDLNYVGVYRSDDAGESWTLPYDGNGDGQPDNNPGGPYSATHWSMSSFGLNGGNYDQGYYNAAIDVSDTDPNMFIVGMLNLFKSTDGGVTFKAHGGYACHNCGPGYRHPDHQSIFVQNSDVWVTTDGGVDLYDGNLEFSVSKNNGITTCDFWGFDQGWNDDVIVGGRYHNGDMVYNENYANGSSLSLGGGESATGFVNLGENRKTYFDDIGGRLIPLSIPGVVSGIPSITKFPRSGNGLEKSEILSDPRYWNHIFLGKDNQLWKSENYGASFTLLHTFGTTGTLRGIEISRKDPKVMFVAQHLGATMKFWKTTNAGVSWTEVAIPVINNRFSFSLNEEDQLYLSFDTGGNNTNKIFKSTDLGATWVNLTTSTLNGFYIMDTEVQEGTNGGVYIIAQRHVFYRNNTMTDWVNISQGLPYSFRMLDAKPFYKSGKLRIAGNRGVWERDFYEPSLPKAQPMVSARETYCDRQVIQFEDHSILNHTGATWLWDFPGASSVSSTTTRNPKVVYSAPGNYSVTLTVTNPQGSSTKTVQNMIVVNQSECSIKPLAEKAVQFTGTSYLTKNFETPKPISNFTFTGWIKPEGIQPNFSSIIFTNGISLDFKNDKNELGTHCGGLWWYNSGLVVPKDKWSYVALVYTPTKVTIVLNEKTYVINGTFAAQNLSYLDFGIHNKRSDRQYKGLLEEASLWDRALTLDEIRQNRHLTKVGNTDPTLFAYYQFNNMNSDLIYDVKGDHDLTNFNSSLLLDSSCPVGPGVAQKLNITQNNSNFNFDVSKVLLGTAATNFNGDVFVTKLNVNPFSKPTADSGIANEYYIINNYGSNANINAMNLLKFSEIANSSTLTIGQVNLYQRERNSDEGTWVNKGNPTSIAGNQISFSPISITSTIPLNNDASSNTLDQSSGQFFLTSNVTLNTLQAEKEAEIILFPNPSSVDSGFSFRNIGEKARLHLYDASGKLIFNDKVKNNEIIKPIKTSGVYFYSIETHNQIKTGKVVIK